jgi:hypothetical protein
MAAWAGHDDWWQNFKPSSYEVVGLLVYPYPMSVYCVNTPPEIEDGMRGRAEVFLDSGDPVGLIYENSMRYLGTILM